MSNTYNVLIRNCLFWWFSNWNFVTTSTYIKKNARMRNVPVMNISQGSLDDDIFQSVCYCFSTTPYLSYYWIYNCGDMKQFFYSVLLTQWLQLSVAFLLQLAFNAIASVGSFFSSTASFSAMASVSSCFSSIQRVLVQ